MTLIEAMENTMLSSCFIESTNGALCFHYYKHKFFLNNGVTIELNNEKKFEECAKLDYVIKYGINEINYSTLKELHEKLEKGEFDSSIDTFLSVYEPENTANLLVKEMIKEKIVENGSMDIVDLKNINFEDVGFTAFTIKYFLNMYKKDSLINSIVYALSFLLLFITGNIFVVNMQSNLSVICLILMFGICCVNDTFEQGVTVHNVIKFCFTSTMCILVNLLFRFNQYTLGMISLIPTVLIYLSNLSFRSKAIKRICSLFNLEVFK